MKSRDYFALLDIAQTMLATHIPHMAYRVPGEHEPHGDLLVDGSTSGAVDMLSPALRWNFDYALHDACNFLSMTFKKALKEGISDPLINDEDDEEFEEDEDDDPDNVHSGGLDVSAD